MSAVSDISTYIIQPVSFFCASSHDESDVMPQNTPEPVGIMRFLPPVKVIRVIILAPVRQGWQRTSRMPTNKPRGS